MRAYVAITENRYLDLCVFVKSTDLKISDGIIGIAPLWNLNFCLFLSNPKYYQNEILCVKSVLYDKHFQLLSGAILESGN